MIEGEAGERAREWSDDGVAILYICAECGEENWILERTYFAHVIKEIECGACGHTIREENEHP